MNRAGRSSRSARKNHRKGSPPRDSHQHLQQIGKRSLGTSLRHPVELLRTSTRYPGTAKRSDLIIVADARRWQKPRSCSTSPRTWPAPPAAGLCVVQPGDEQSPAHLTALLSMEGWASRAGGCAPGGLQQEEWPRLGQGAQTPSASCRCSIDDNQWPVLSRCAPSAAAVPSRARSWA